MQLEMKLHTHTQKILLSFLAVCVKCIKTCALLLQRITWLASLVYVLTHHALAKLFATVTCIKIRHEEVDSSLSVVQQEECWALKVLWRSLSLMNQPLLELWKLKTSFASRLPSAFRCNGSYGRTFPHYYAHNGHNCNQNHRRKGIRVSSCCGPHWPSLTLILIWDNLCLNLNE